jgi:hypothetical protein
MPIFKTVASKNEGIDAITNFIPIQSSDKK